jgi:NAD(P)-dependent dehydrogenase (short-subunit alcohol dehydrogenase family)
VLDEAVARLDGIRKGASRARSVDIRDAAAVEAALDASWSEGKPVTHLVNNAAGNFISRTEDLSHRGFAAIANTVFHGTFHVTQAVGKRWIADGTGGAVVSILVSWIWTGAPFVVPSAMSKAGLAAMTRSLAVEWGRYGIRLNAIAPGTIPTKGASERLHPGEDPVAEPAARNPQKRVGEPEELGNLIAFLLAPGCTWLSGQLLALDGADSLANGASTTKYLGWSDGEWTTARESIRAQDAGDKAQRDTVREGVKR